MTIFEVKELLEKKEKDLQTDMALHEGEARDDARPEAREHMDQVISSEDSEGQFQQATSDWRLIVQVREALARIELGTYGICVDCGRRIEPTRLAAIPWTPYCLDDENRRERLSPGGDTSPPTL